MNRREFFKSGASLALVGATTPIIGHASASTDGLFTVLIRCRGGWDVTLGLDPWLEEERPKEEDMFIEYSHNELVDVGNNIFLGPSAEPLKKHSDDISIVNGVFMSQVDNGHGAAEVYMSTGNGAGAIASLPVEIANYGRRGSYGVFYNSTLTTATRETNSSTFDEIINLPNSFDSAQVLRTIFSGASFSTSYARAVKSLIESGVVTTDLVKRIEELSKRFNTIPDEHVLLAGFLSGACRQAQMTIIEALDTHANHQGQHKRTQRKVWRKISEIFDLFKKTEYANGISMFDRTLFIVTSEFARTPALNAAKGKDHNPLTNSVLFAGNGFKKKQMIGASKLITAQEAKNNSSYHIAYPINYQTGEIEFTRSDSSEMIFPENIIKTAAKIALPNVENYTTLPKTTKLLERLI